MALPDVSSESLAWLAGLAEGEGYFYSRRRNGPRSQLNSFGLSITTTDEDVARRAAEAMGGKVYGPYTYKHKPIWRANLERREDVMDLVKKLKPMMGKRRQAAIEEMIELSEQNPLKRK